MIASRLRDLRLSAPRQRDDRAELTSGTPGQGGAAFRRNHDGGSKTLGDLLSYDFGCLIAERAAGHNSNDDPIGGNLLHLTFEDAIDSFERRIQTSD